MNRFHAAGLWANPFDSIVPPLTAYQPAPALQAFAEGRTPLLVVRGPSGYGKSTALAFAANEISRRGQESRLVYVEPNAPRPDLNPPPGGALLVDEANRLWPDEIIRLVRSARTAGCLLALATHRPDDWWLEPTAGAMALVLSPWRDPAILSGIAEGRARHVQIGPMNFQVDLPVAGAVMAETGGVPLRALRFLYWLLDVCADVCRPTLADIPAARAAFRQFEPPAASIFEQLADWRPS